MQKNFKRSAGTLLHISSLPGPFGIGTLGKSAYDFVDKLADAGMSYWQILPLTPINDAISPYSSISAFASNVLFIAPEILVEMGYLAEKELQYFYYSEQDSIKTNYQFAFANADKYLSLAFSRFDDRGESELREFIQTEKEWLLDYAYFIVLHEFYDKAWYEWPEPAKFRDEEFLEDFFSQEDMQEKVLEICFRQWLFFKQWFSLKNYANSKGVKLFGDMPIYLSYDSVDLWTRPREFMLDAEFKPLMVSGFPAFTEDGEGQIWNNPLYNWAEMSKNNYEWWINRISHSMRILDTMRIDHFRAFAHFFAIPNDSNTTKTGVWLEGPGLGFFEEVQKRVANLEIIAEDLGGESDPLVREILKCNNFPGMMVMINEFMWGKGAENLPYTYKDNKIAYTSTHDSYTIIGWLNEKENKHNRDFALDYCDAKFKDTKKDNEKKLAVAKSFIKTCWNTKAIITMVPVQDLLALDNSRAMNKPGTVNDFNWTFRITKNELDQIDTQWIYDLNETYQRIVKNELEK